MKEIKNRKFQKTFIYFVATATVQAQYEYTPQVPDEYFDSFYVGDYNTTSDDFYNTYDYGQTGIILSLTVVSRRNAALTVL